MYSSVKDIVRDMSFLMFFCTLGEESKKFIQTLFLSYTAAELYASNYQLQFYWSLFF